MTFCLCVALVVTAKMKGVVADSVKKQVENIVTASKLAWEEKGNSKKD